MAYVSFESVWMAATVWLDSFAVSAGSFSLRAVSLRAVSLACKNFFFIFFFHLSKRKNKKKLEFHCHARLNALINECEVAMVLVGALKTFISTSINESWWCFKVFKSLRPSPCLTWCSKFPERNQINWQINSLTSSPNRIGSSPKFFSLGSSVQTKVRSSSAGMAANFFFLFFPQLGIEFLEF